MRKLPKQVFEKHLQELARSATLVTEHSQILQCLRCKKYSEILREYSGYFYWAINAHKYALALALSQLYEQKKNTHNLTELLCHAETHNLLPAALIRKQRTRLSRVENIVRQLLKMRHHRYAHKAIKLTESEANLRFKVPNNGLQRLIRTASCILNDISHAHSRRTDSHFSHDGRVEFSHLLDDLKRYQKLRDKSG